MKKGSLRLLVAIMFALCVGGVVPIEVGDSSNDVALADETDSYRVIGEGYTTVFRDGDPATFYVIDQEEIIQNGEISFTSSNPDDVIRRKADGLGVYYAADIDFSGIGERIISATDSTGTMVISSLTVNVRALVRYPYPILPTANPDDYEEKDYSYRTIEYGMATWDIVSDPNLAIVDDETLATLNSALPNHSFVVNNMYNHGEATWAELIEAYNEAVVAYNAVAQQLNNFYANPVTITKTVITGPASVTNGDSATYTITQTYSDGTTKNLTSGLKSSNGGDVISGTKVTFNGVGTRTLSVEGTSGALIVTVTEKTSGSTDPEEPTDPDENAVAKVPMFRLYNKNNGAHFYTKSQAERNHLVSLGWSAEGTGWNAPDSGITVYRLYNPNSGEHVFTTSSAERQNVIRAGWDDEGIGFYSADNTDKPVYRLFNPNAEDAGSHHFTTDQKERDHLVSLGWKNEGIGWYGMNE